MWEWLKQWPFLGAGLICLAVGVELARRDNDLAAPRAVLYAVGSLLIGYSIGRRHD